MAIFDLFSKRQKKLRGELPDVYQYTKIPQKFKVQVVHIIKDTIGDDLKYDNSEATKIYSFIHQILCKEYGVFTLTKYADSNFSAVYDYFLSEIYYERCLDIIEISFKIINAYVKDNNFAFTDSKQTAEDAIEELNIRFKDTGLGYQFESGQLIRIDSQFIHTEVIKPVLQVLGSKKEYQGANSEFLAAHEHYRHQRYKECLNDCLKSFESLMKTIHKKKSWSFSDTDTAKKLINSCLSNNLVPNYLQNQFSSIRILLESGIPTIRNKEGGHGQGCEISEVPEYLASYALHLTASNLLFLVKCEENL